MPSEQNTNMRLALYGLISALVGDLARKTIRKGQKMNNLKLGAGKIFIDGVEFNGIGEFTCEEETAETNETPIIERIEPGVLTISGMIENFSRQFNELWDILVERLRALELYPNNRIKWLALHAKKPRTRKKNMHRILKQYRKGR